MNQLIDVIGGGSPGSLPHFWAPAYSPGLGNIEIFRNSKRCKNGLPLKKDSNWTRVAFKWNVPPGNLMSEVQGCLAYDDGKTYLRHQVPTGAGMNGAMMRCRFRRNKPNTESPVATTVAVAPIVETLQNETSFGYAELGFSVTEAFQSPDITFYNGGMDLSTVRLNPSLFYAVAMNIDGETFGRRIKDFFQVGGNFLYGIKVLPNTPEGKPPSSEEITHVLNTFDTTKDENGFTADITRELSERWTVMASLTGYMKGKIMFSKIPFLRAIFDDSDAFDVAHASSVVTTGKTIVDGEIVSPGFSLFAPVGPTGMSIDFAKHIIASVGSIMVRLRIHLSFVILRC